MLHIWLPNPQANFRVWQDTTQTWQTAENWQEIAALASLQSNKAPTKTACLYFPSLNLLKVQSNLTAPQLKALGESGRQYLFEDMSITAVDDLQIKSYQAPDQSTILYAIHASDREQWLQAAHLVGMEIVALLPDFLLLPSPMTANGTHPAVFYQDEATQLLRFELDSPHPQGVAVSYLPLLLGKMPAIDYVYLTGIIAPALLEQLDAITTISYQVDEQRPKPVSEPTRQLLNFAVLKRDTQLTPYLKTIAAVSLLAVLTAFVVDGLRWYHYQKAEQQAKALLQQQYTQWFPNEPFNPSLNIQRLVSGKLVSEQGTTPNIMMTLGSIQPILQQYQITARQLNYQNNQLQLQLIAKNGDVLNQAITALTAQGVAAKLGTVTPNESGAVAMVEIGL